MITKFSGTYSPVPVDTFQKSELHLDNSMHVWAKSMQEKVLQKLNALKIKTDDISYMIGATTTTLYITPHPTIRMTRFRNIEDDISIAVGAKCRVIAPLPNTEYVGVEIPTEKRTTVGLGGLYGGKGELPVSMGIQPDGRVLNFDLTKMPHLLIAGASGQGKSVGLNVIIMNLLQTQCPWDLNLYLIDPKRVEFKDYEALENTRILKRIDTDVSSAERLSLIHI